MVSAVRREGAYLDQESNQVLRVGTGVPPPEGNRWVKPTGDPNATPRALRKLADGRGLPASADSLPWA